MTIPTVMPDNHDDLPEEIISPEVTLQWLDGGRILMTRGTMIQPSSFELWEARIRGIYDKWPSDRRLYTLYDVRAHQAGITLQMGTQIRFLVQSYPHLHSTTAVVYSARSMTSALVATLRMIEQAPGSLRDFFTDFDAARVWLQTQYQNDAQAK